MSVVCRTAKRIDGPSSIRSPLTPTWMHRPYGASEAIACFSTAFRPTKSNDASTPSPPVAARIAAIAPSGSAVRSAPSERARSRADASGSIAAMNPAPARRAICTACVPSPPIPNTATLSPAFTFPTSTTALYGVATQSARIAPTSNETSSGSRTHVCAGVTT
jgi:hypothetical protein